MKWHYVFIIYIVLVGVWCAIFMPSSNYAYAIDTDMEDTQQSLEESVYDRLSNIDLSNFEDVINNLSPESLNIFGNKSFFQKVNSILSGDVGDNFGSFLLAILDLFFGNIIKYIPIICVVVGIAILGTLVNGIRSEESNIQGIVNFVCFSLIIVLISTQCVGLLNEVCGCVNGLKVQMDLMFPLLLTLLASVGGVTSAGIFQASTAVLANIILQLFTIIIIPLFLVSFVFSILGNLVESVKLSKFNDLLNTILKWLIGIIFGVFTFVLTIQGIVAGSYDGMSINATKFALKSYIPILGGYLSDGFNYVAASGILIKNSIGFAGLVLLIATIIPTFVRILVLAILLKLASAIIQPMGASKISDFLTQVSKLLFYLIGILLVISFMYILSVGLIMCVANII